MALRKDAKLDLIKGSPLFAHCSKEDLQRISQITDQLAERVDADEPADNH